MRRKLPVALALVIVAGFLVWFFALRDRGHAPATVKAPPTGTDKPATPAPEASAAGSGSADVPRGPAVRWRLDVDPEGPLRLEGQVVDEGGDPVGGATVRLNAVPPRTATTEGDGSFAFDKLVGREYTLSAVAGNRIAGPIGHHLTATSAPAVLHLVAGATLAVTVVDAASKPIEKASVEVLDGASASTDRDGKASVAPVHAGWHSVVASAPGYATGSVFAQVGAAGATAQVTITLRQGVSVAGRVVDENGTPVKGARVTTAGVWNVASQTKPTETDDKGTFELPTLAAGTYTLVATDGEHAPGRSASIAVEDKAVTGIEITMPAGGVLAGAVVDGQGAPVPFATVRVGGEGQDMFLVDNRQATTDKAGAFELRGLARMPLKIRAESETAASAVVAIDLKTVPAKRDLRLVLDVVGTIAGIVVDESGQPVIEVQVNAFPDLFGGGAQEDLVLAGMSSDTTDGGGRFTIRGLPDGAYRVRAARATRGQFDWGQQGVTAKTGDTNVRITLAAPGSITGTLVLDTGKAPTLANVTLGYQSAKVAKPDGTFTINDVEPGTYDLNVRGPEFAGYRKENIVVAPGKPTDVGTLTLLRGRTLTGIVVDAKGAKVAGAKIKAGDVLWSTQGGVDDQMASLEEMSGQRTTTSAADGTFTLRGLPAKSTSVMAEHPQRGRSNAVELPAGSDDLPAIELRLRGYGTIVGTVTSQGKPISGATVTATPKGAGAQVQAVQTGTDGTFTLAKVPEGTVVLSAIQQTMMTMSMKSASSEVTVTAGAQAKVTLDIPVGSVALTIEIKPQAGAQVDAAQVFLMRGIVAMKTAKAVNDAFLAGQVVGMKFWFGAGKPLPEFTELVPGDYSACSIPITGDLNNPTFQQRLQAHLDVLGVYCKQAKVASSPAKQSVVQELPAMNALPE